MVNTLKKAKFIIFDISDYRKILKEKKSVIEKCIFLRDLITDIEAELVGIEEHEEIKRVQILLKQLKIYHCRVLKDIDEDKIKKPKAIHSIGDFIPWTKTYTQLETFLRSLIEKKLIKGYKESDISTLAENHFEHEQITNNLTKTKSKILWDRSLPELADLIGKLSEDNGGYIKPCNQIHKLFSNHFLDKQKKPVNNEYLGKASSLINGRAPDKKVPKQAEIDKIFTKLKKTN